jgi:mono/diheme cytochrome c family protein
MNQITKRLVAGSLALFLLAFLLVALTTDEARLQGDPARPVYGSPRSAAGAVRQLNFGEQSKRKSSFVSDLFRNNCARCHGADGRADTPLGRTYQTPDLTDPEWWRKNSKITSTASLVSIVTKGKGGMPAFGKKLKRSEIRLLVGYARKFKNQRAANR